MKVKILSLIAAAGLFLASCSTSYKSTSNGAAYNVNVPVSLQHNFAIAYPDATSIVWNSYDANNLPIDWDLTDWTPLTSGDYVVTFNVGNAPYYAWYDANGNLIGTTSTISDYNYLPYNVTTMLHNQYANYTIDGVQKEMRGTNSAWEIKLKGTDGTTTKLLVDANGNIIKQKAK